MVYHSKCPTKKVLAILSIFVLIITFVAICVKSYYFRKKPYMAKNYGAGIEEIWEDIKSSSVIYLEKISGNLDDTNEDEEVFAISEHNCSLGFLAKLYVVTKQHSQYRILLFDDKLGEGFVSLSIEDLNKDGRNELAVIFTSGKLEGIKIYAWKEEGFQNLIWEEKGLEPYCGGGIELKDLDGDDIIEVIVTVRDYEITDKIGWISHVYKWNPIQQQWRRPIMPGR